MNYASVIAATLVGLRLALALVFIVAGGAKWIGRTSFREALSGYSWIPSFAKGLLSIIIPLFELLLGVLLLSGFAQQVVLAASSIALGFFVVISAIDLLSGNRHDCGCFGKHQLLTSHGAGLVIRNVCLFAAATVSLAAIA